MSTVRNELEGPYVVRTIIEWSGMMAESQMGGATAHLESIALDIESDTSVDSWQDKIDEAEHEVDQMREELNEARWDEQQAKDDAAGFRKRLTAIVNRMRLDPKSRWPCPDCGRLGPNDPLRGLAVAVLPYVSPKLTPVPASFKPTQFVGCWRCVSDDVIEDAALVLGAKP